MGRHREASKSRLKRRVAHALRTAVRRAGGRRKTMREVASLAWPIAAAMAGETLLGLVDTKLVSGLGPEALGGVAVAMMIVFLLYTVVFGLMRGMKVCVAHAVGEGHAYRSVRYDRRPSGSVCSRGPPSRRARATWGLSSRCSASTRASWSPRAHSWRRSPSVRPGRRSCAR